MDRTITQVHTVIPNTETKDQNRNTRAYFETDARQTSTPDINPQHHRRTYSQQQQQRYQQTQQKQHRTRTPTTLNKQKRTTSMTSHATSTRPLSKMTLVVCMMLALMVAQTVTSQRLRRARANAIKPTRMQRFLWSDYSSNDDETSGDSNARSGSYDNDEDGDSGEVVHKRSKYSGPSGPSGGKGKGSKASKSTKAPTSSDESGDVDVPTAAPTMEGNSTEELPPLGSNVTIIAFQPNDPSVVPPTPDGSDLDAGTLFLYTNFTRNATNVSNFESTAFVDLEAALLVWTRVDGYCQRLEDGESSGLCRFTYTVADPETEAEIGSFVASGFLKLRPGGGDIISALNGEDSGDSSEAESATLSVKGGTDLFEGVTGQVFINPADLDLDFDPPRVVEAEGDILTEPMGYVHGIFLILDSFFGTAMEARR